MTARPARSRPGFTRSGSTRGRSGTPWGMTLIRMGLTPYTRARSVAAACDMTTTPSTAAHSPARMRCCEGVGVRRTVCSVATAGIGRARTKSSTYSPSTAAPDPVFVLDGDELDAVAGQAGRRRTVVRQDIAPNPMVDLQRVDRGRARRVEGDHRLDPRRPHEVAREHGDAAVARGIGGHDGRPEGQRVAPLVRAPWPARSVARSVSRRGHHVMTVRHVAQPCTDIAGHRPAFGTWHRAKVGRAPHSVGVAPRRRAMSTSPVPAATASRG